MVCRFLLVSLNIDVILREVTVSTRRERLNEMTKGTHLGDVYATTLDRIKIQKGGRSRLGVEALMWVSNSERPLKTSELCHALGVKKGSTDLDPENIPEIRTILASSLGLVTVEPSSDTVRLVHFTLQEYLSNYPSLFQSPHSMITEICLTYLNFRCVRELSPTRRLVQSTVPLVQYASHYWGQHMRRDKTESVPPLALRLLVGFEEHISSRLLLLHFYEDRYWSDAPLWGLNHKGFPGLHGAAFLGLREILAVLLTMKEWNINAVDTVGRTALAWAVIRGHEDVVKILLQSKDADPNVGDTQYGRAPLWLAVGNGHEGMVKLLLDRDDINPNTRDTEYGRTPLGWVARSGHARLVKMLLERGDINPNTADIFYDRTPLWWAAKGGHGRVAKLLLEREDINPNIADIKYGRTPLWWATEGGYQGIVKLLLNHKDINPNTADTEYCRTPLWWAVKGGHEGVVRLLLEQEDINPNTADTKYCRTPLCWAADSGHEAMVKLLLEREDLNPHIPSLTGQTALELAASKGHAGVVQLLSETKPSLPISIDTKNSPERLSPESSDLVQSPSQPFPPACPPPSKDLPPDYRPLLNIAILSFIILSSLIFLF